MTEQTTPPTEPQQPPAAPQTPVPAPAPQEAAAVQPAPEPAPAPVQAEQPPKKKGGWGKWVALGCGCLFIVMLAVVAILAAIAIPVFTRAQSGAKDLAAISKLRNAGTAAAMYAADHDGGFVSMDAASLAAKDSSVRFNDGTPGPDMQAGVIYVDKLAADANKYSVAIKSDSGTIFRMTYEKGTAKIEKSQDGAVWSEFVKT